MNIMSLMLFLIVIPYGVKAKCHLKTPDEVLDHIKKSHPEVVAGKAQTKVFEKDIEKASQRPNPRVELKSMTPEDKFGKEETVIGGQFKHTFELGGKRQARVRFKQSKLRQQEIRVEEKIDHSLHLVVKTLNQVHHLNSLIPLYTQGIKSFKKLLGRIDKLPSKSPSEEVGKTTLEMVIEDYKMRKSKIEGKKEVLLSQVEFFIDEKCSWSSSIFEREATLRTLSKELDQTFNQAAAYKLSHNNIEMQKKKLALEQAQGWTDLEIGPSVEYRESELNPSREIFKVGVALEFQLPLFHTNDGGKARAHKKLKEQKFRFKVKKKELRLKLKRLRRNYKMYKRKLARLQKMGDIKKKKKKVEDDFSRGTISTGLIIEVHRQFLNWHHQRFHFQQSALDSLWKINELTGQIKTAKY